jgi:hypothetical protein
MWVDATELFLGLIVGTCEVVGRHDDGGDKGSSVGMMDGGT